MNFDFCSFMLGIIGISLFYGGVITLVDWVHARKDRNSEWVRVQFMFSRPSWAAFKEIKAALGVESFSKVLLAAFDALCEKEGIDLKALEEKSKEEVKNERD